MKKFMILVAMILLLSGCGNEGTAIQGKDGTADNSLFDQAQASETAGEGYSFQYNDVTIPMNVEAAPIIELLGEPVEYFEAASCAFQGLDKIFYYNGFELGTYPNGDKDYISYVNLLDDSTATDKGVYLGSSMEEVTAAYGKDYMVEGSSYEYRLGDTKLTFILENNTVIQITYYAIVEGLNN
jgi:uncharacterized protein YceK